MMSANKPRSQSMGRRPSVRHPTTNPFLIHIQEMQ
jgi:hypothetical protein